MKISAKYNMLYPLLIERIIAEESKKKDPVKAAKTRMHQLYGAYFQGSVHKKAVEAIRQIDREEVSISCRTGHYPFAVEILNLHASTRERMPYLPAFHAFIKEHIGDEKIRTILDLGCGFNPFAIPLMPIELTQNLETCHAYDIDLRLEDLLNSFFEKIGLPATAGCADLAVETPCCPADLTFMLKLIPVLEMQVKNRGFELANSLDTGFLVISYPIKSLGGRDKGMEKNYSASFENALKCGLLCNFTLIANKKIGNELVYLLRR